MSTFPLNIPEFENTKNIANKLFGNRFHNDQTLYEYLIEFLLIFVSAKDIDTYSDTLRFHTPNEELSYYAERKMGLKRFIFYDNAKKDTSIPLDENAYNELCSLIKENMDTTTSEEAETALSALQDLLRGYAVVLKKRSWCAQQTLPICPELVFCEAMPNQKKRLINTKSHTEITIDSEFEFAQRNFLARGGELYYLHLLQALEKDSTGEKRNKLNYLLKTLMCKQGANISKLSRSIINEWENKIVNENTDKSKLYQEYKLSYIPEKAYRKCEGFAVDELINYLSSDFQQIKKIEILAKGVMFQVMRMMCCAVSEELNQEVKPWIVDMTNNSSSAVKKIATESFMLVEEDFKNAINKKAKEMNLEEQELIKRIREGQKESLDIFRSKGKEMRCIIPISGSSERFTLSEDVLRFLVTSLITPGERITLNMFLDRLYEHYHIVIGPKQYENCINKANVDNINIKNSLYENEICFQKFMKSTGFLKELSDSTSLVYNPYNLVDEEDAL